MFIRPGHLLSSFGLQTQSRPQEGMAEGNAGYGDGLHLSGEHEQEPSAQGFFGRLFGAFGWGQSPASEAVSAALEGEGRGRFINGNGEEVDFELARGEDSATHERYWLTLGEDRLGVNVQHGLDSQLALSRVADFYSQQEESLRGVVHTVNLEAGRSPDDERFARERNQPNFRSAATGGGGTISFFNGLGNLTEDRFDHEFGHNLGFAARNLQDAESAELGRLNLDRQRDALTGDNFSPNIPRGYSQAAEADARMVSRYGEETISEDFAEFYEAYLDAEQAGPRALARFEQRYPNRFAILNELVLPRFA